MVALKRSVLWLFVSLWIGCSEHFTKDELVGKYVLNVGPGSGVIELKMNWTYSHSFQDDSFPKATNIGKWELDSISNGQTVILEGFNPLPGEQTNGNGFYLLKPSTSFGKIRLMRNSDLNEYYEKE